MRAWAQGRVADLVSVPFATEQMPVRKPRAEPVRRPWAGPGRPVVGRAQVPRAWEPQAWPEWAAPEWALSG